MENQLKAQVLKGIMKAMLAKDGNKIRPKHVAVEVSSEGSPQEGDPSQPIPHMSSGGIVEDDRLHLGEGSDISDDDARVLEGLYSENEGRTEHDHVDLSEKPEDDDDEDEESGLV